MRLCFMIFRNFAWQIEIFSAFRVRVSCVFAIIMPPYFVGLNTLAGVVKHILWSDFEICTIRMGLHRVLASGAAYDIHL